jgi:arsenical pump membrane protein
MQLEHTILTSAGQAWPPFVLVTGLVLIGASAAVDGLFEALGARLAHARLGARGLLLALLGLVAAVTAVLNLDTSVVFLTPVLGHAPGAAGWTSGRSCTARCSWPTRPRSSSPAPT